MDNTSSPPLHKSGFVNIIGRPNAGKSTLLNALMEDKMAIVSPKPQTTRHRALGILSTDNYQIIFSDTPGFIEQPHYKMQERMNQYIAISFEDADIAILLTDAEDRYTEDHYLIKKLQKLKCPKFLVINKIDQLQSGDVLQSLNQWQTILKADEYIPISALTKRNIGKLKDLILQYLPEGPAYYPKDQWSNKSERFFVCEIVRESILEQFHQEIPYSVEIQVESFKEADDIIRIQSYIFVNRDSQKSILIGKGGSAIKKLGISARKKLEAFFSKKIYLELRVKVRDNWRNDDNWLRRFGYEQ